jgi:hypothetical protein
MGISTAFPPVPTADEVIQKEKTSGNPLENRGMHLGRIWFVRFDCPKMEWNRWMWNELNR